MNKIIQLIAVFLQRLAQFELDTLEPEVSRLQDRVANLNREQNERLAAYDAEAKVQRDHFLAKLQIDAITTRRDLAAKQHRLEVLRRSVVEGVKA